MRKFLFISSMIGSTLSGGTQCSNRNYNSLVRLYGEENILVYKLIYFDKDKANAKTFLNALWNTLTLRVTGATKKAEIEIIDIINKNNISDVFIDSSLNGRLVKTLKSALKINIVSFFHNCEYDIVKQEFFDGKILMLPKIYSSFLGERLTVKYSDKSIGLCKRDSSKIKKYYGKALDYIVPISFQDKFEKHDLINNKEQNSLLKILFVGSLFYPNVHGINWFVNNVFPNINAKLVIVGKDIDQIKIQKTERIEIYSNVPTLDSFYEDSDVVIAPIFKGSGMKVKVAEALMYGKCIVGTSEALNGYEKVNGIYEANTADEFTRILRKENFTPFNIDIRNLFITRYSFDSTLNIFKEILQ